VLEVFTTKLARYPVVSLDLAGKKADELLLKIEGGQDPREAQPSNAPVTVAEGVRR